MFRFVLGFALGSALRYPSGVKWCWYANDNISSKEFAAVVRPYSNAVLDFCFTHFVHDRVHFERQVDIFRGPVTHELKLTVRGNEVDDPISIELAKLDTLVELAVLESDATCCCSCGLGAGSGAGRRGEVILAECEPVIEAELALRSSAEIRPHHDLAVDVGSQNGSGCRHEKVHVLNNIHKRFVFSVLDVRPSPRQRSSGLHGDFRRVLLQ